MSSLSTHVLDTERGEPARGIRVEVYRGNELLSAGKTDADGRIRQLAEIADPGAYRLVFHPEASPFFRRIEFELNIEDTAVNLHVPLLLSPYSCTTYRGS